MDDRELTNPNPNSNVPDAGTPAPPAVPNTQDVNALPVVSPDRQQQTSQMVSNPSPTPAQPAQPQTDPNATHPAVQHASLLHTIAETLAGGPRYKPMIDANGNRTLQRIPLDRKDIGMAIAMSAISGALSGLQARGPNASAQAAGRGFATTSAMRSEADQAAEQKAQQDFANRSKALATKAAVFETNSRTLLNTAEAEKYGADALDKIIEQNRASGVLDVDANTNAYDFNGQPMTQAEMQDGMKNGRIAPTDQLGPVAGRVEVTNADGTKRWEATHLIVKDPNTPIQITPAIYDRFASLGVPGFPAKESDAGKTFSLPMRTVQRSNEIANAHMLSDYRLQDIRQEMSGTQWADKVPANVDFSQPGVVTAMSRFQKYVSHANQHGMDVYESLLAMGADSKRDPHTGQMAPNPDAKYVDTVAQSLGGWPLLKAMHDKLEADTAGSKAAGEMAAKQPYEIQKENRLEANREQRDDLRQAEKDRRTPVYAEDANGQLVLSNKHDHPEGEEVKPGDINKDRQAIRQLNDVQLNVSRYTKAARNAQPLTNADLTAMHTIMNHAGVFDLEASIAKGGQITIPVVTAVGEGLSRQMRSKEYASLSPQAKALLDGYVRTMASVPAYQKALTGIGRTNKEMLDLELANVPNPTMQPADISRKLGQFQENIDRATEGFPRLPGLKHPSDVRKEMEGGPSPMYAKNPQTGQRVVSNDGGKTWQPTQ
jgi:hypothetical protein